MKIVLFAFTFFLNLNLSSCLVAMEKLIEEAPTIIEDIQSLRLKIQLKNNKEVRKTTEEILDQLSESLSPIFQSIQKTARWNEDWNSSTVGASNKLSEIGIDPKDYTQVLFASLGVSFEEHYFNGLQKAITTISPEKLTKDLDQIIKRKLREIITGSTLIEDFAIHILFGIAEKKIDRKTSL